VRRGLTLAHADPLTVGGSSSSCTSDLRPFESALRHRMPVHERMIVTSALCAAARLASFSGPLGAPVSVNTDSRLVRSSDGRR
jgi:hypothetical protein